MLSCLPFPPPRGTADPDAIHGGRITSMIGFGELERSAVAVLGAGEEARRDDALKAIGEQHSVCRLVEDLEGCVRVREGV